MSDFSFRLIQHDGIIYLNLFWKAAHHALKRTANEERQWPVLPPDFKSTWECLALAHRLTQQHSFFFSQKLVEEIDIFRCIMCGSDIMKCLELAQASPMANSVLYLKVAPYDMAHLINLRYKEHNRPRLSVGLGLVGNLQGGEKKNGSDQTDQHTVERKPGKLWSNLKRKEDFLNYVAESQVPESFPKKLPSKRIGRRFWHHEDIVECGRIIQHLQQIQVEPGSVLEAKYLARLETEVQRFEALVSICQLCAVEQEGVKTVEGWAVVEDTYAEFNVPFRNIQGERLDLLRLLPDSKICRSCANLLCCYGSHVVSRGVLQEEEPIIIYFSWELVQLSGLSTQKYT